MNVEGVQVNGVNVVSGPEFSYNGCDNCGTGHGADVSEVSVYLASGDTEILNLCHTCICAYCNAEGLDEDCKDVYNI